MLFACNWRATDLADVFRSRAKKGGFGGAVILLIIIQIGSSTDLVPNKYRTR